MASTTTILPPRYREPVLLAQGGMGDIYTATDTTLQRNVAVKVLSDRFARDPELRRRFEREARAAARLSGDPHTVAIYDVGEYGGRPYIVMEYVPGGTVGSRLADGQAGIGEALRWLEETGAALDAAHAKGVVHRDVKPANLLLTGEGSVRVADFGIASAAGLTSLTAAGTILGTVGYLAPEQAAGDGAGPPADRYALAVVAYELLTGRRPFDRGGNMAAEAVAAAREPAPPVRTLQQTLPDTLDAVFARALAPRPEDRYASCGSFVSALRTAFRAQAAPTQPAVPRYATTSRRRSPLPSLLALLVLLAAAGGAAALVFRGHGNGTPLTRAVAHTVTVRGSTVTVTTPAEPAPTTSPAATTAPATTAPAAAGADGVTLNDEGYAKLRAGDYTGALPLLEQAVQKLQGTNSLAEAYALYNLALARFATGSCTGVAQLLDQSQAIQGHRAEIDRLRPQVRKRCG